VPGPDADIRIAAYLEAHGYHPRSSAHGDALCRFVLDDLMSYCVSFRESAEAGRIVYDLNYNVGAGGQMSWNIDLVVGPPKTPVFGQSLKIRRGEPSEIWIALDAKSVMTEHGKARRNRQRDLNSLHDVLHRRDPGTIVAGLVVVNIAPRFRSPLRIGEPTVHRNIERLVKETIQMYADLPQRSRVDQQGLDAVGVIVVNHTNVKGDGTVLATQPPAPVEGEPLNYRVFLRSVCEAFGSRFGKTAT